MITIQFAERRRELIEGDWGLLPDPMERCRRQAWWRSVRKPGEFFPSYDDDAFWPTRVPGSYQIQHPSLEFFEGNIIYRLEFSSVPAHPAERVFLSFEGIADRCVIFLNGRWVGAHDGPFTPFSCEVTRQLACHNRLLVIVDCKRLADSVPGEIHDWFHYGGVHGPVSLYRLPRKFVQCCALETRLSDAEALLRVRVRLFADTREEALPFTARLLDDNGGEVCRWEGHARPGAWETVETRHPRADLRLWSPDTPVLYRLVVETAEDRWEDEVGLREVRTSGKAILLNGEPVFLRGVCTWIHDEHTGLLSASGSTMQRLIEVAGRLRANFFRAGHWPQGREYVKACNRAGILVWMEIPAYWMPNIADPAPTARALAHAEESLCAFRNDPSIILWSVGNECVYHDTELPKTNLPYFIRAAEFYHSQDQTRLVTYTGGMEGALTPHVEKICPPELVEHLDVIGVNSYAGIHDGAIPDKPAEVNDLAAQLRTASEFGRPVILAENGIDAVLGETGFDFGEVRQDRYYEKVLEILETLRREGIVQGVSFFVLSDYRTPIKLSLHQNGFNRKGLMTQDLQPKRAFARVAEAYGRIKGTSCA